MVDSCFRRRCMQPQMRTVRAAILVFLIAELVSFTAVGAGISSAGLMIDPDVRELVRAGAAVHIRPNARPRDRRDRPPRARDDDRRRRCR